MPKTYFISPDWYPRSDTNQVLTVGTVGTDRAFTKGETRWPNQKEVFPTLQLPAERAGSLTLHQSSCSDVSAWLTLLETLSISVSSAKAASTSVQLRWTELEREEIHPNFPFSAHCNQLVKTDLRTAGDHDETMADAMKLGMKMKFRKSLYMVTGLYYAKGLKILVDEQTRQGFEVKGQGSEPQSQIGGGTSVQKAKEKKFVFHHQMKPETVVIMGVQVHEIRPRHLLSDKVTSALLKGAPGQLLGDGKGKDKIPKEDNEDKVAIVETSEGVLFEDRDFEMDAVEKEPAEIEI